MTPENDNFTNGNGEGEQAAEPQAEAAPQNELELLKAENAALKDRALRAMADTENLRKRAEREKLDATQYAITRFAREVLTVADNLARALQAVSPEVRATDNAVKAVIEGVEATPLLKTSASDARTIRRLTRVLLAVSGVSFLLALLSVGAATAALVGERRVEVGLMLALGYSGRRIGGMLAAELLAAALVAALIGELLGELAASGLERRLLGGAGGLILTWSGLAGAATVAVLVVGASLAVALRRIERLDSAVVLRGE